MDTLTALIDTTAQEHVGERPADDASAVSDLKRPGSDLKRDAKQKDRRDPRQTDKQTDN